MTCLTKQIFKNSHAVCVLFQQEGTSNLSGIDGSREGVINEVLHLGVALKVGPKLG